MTTAKRPDVTHTRKITGCPVEEAADVLAACDLGRGPLHRHPHSNMSAPALKAEKGSRIPQEAPMNKTTKTNAPAWPKLEIIGHDGQREKIVELATGAELGISERTLDSLRKLQTKGVLLQDHREAFVYTAEDCARDAALELLDGAKFLRDLVRCHAIVPHRKENPAAWDGWNEALAAIAKAEAR
jgi:hypothetical protein